MWSSSNAPQPSAASSLTPIEIELIPSRALPLTPQLTHLLDIFTALSLQLFTHLTVKEPLSGHAAKTANIFQDLVLLDIKLAGVIKLVVEHQQKKVHIDSLISSLNETEASWRRTTKLLYSSVQTLKPIVASGELDRRNIAAARSAAVTPSVLLAYARLLAPFTSAPPSALFTAQEKMEPGAMDPSGRGLPINARPPFPTEGMMRSGRLQFGEREGEVGGVVSEVGSKLIISRSFQSND
jgi:hypothetical protein